MNRDEAFSRFLGRVRSISLEDSASLRAASRLVLDDAGQPILHNFGGFITSLTADWRCYDLTPRVLAAILQAWMPPSWHQVEAVWNPDRVSGAAVRFHAAAAAVAVEMAAHGGIVPSRPADPLAFRRVAAGSLPQQAQELIPAAHEALTAYALAFLGHLGTQEGHSALLDYLPARPATLEGVA